MEVEVSTDRHVAEDPILRIMCAYELGDFTSCTLGCRDAESVAVESAGLSRPRATSASSVSPVAEACEATIGRLARLRAAHDASPW